MKGNPLQVADAPLALLLSNLDAKLVASAMKLAIERLDLTPEKLATILVRAFNPDETIGQAEEAKLRGLRPETLKKYKDASEYPLHVNGK